MSSRRMDHSGDDSFSHGVDTAPLDPGSPLREAVLMQGVLQDHKTRDQQDDGDDDDDSKAETSSTTTAASSMSLRNMESSDSLSTTRHDVRHTNVQVCVRVRPLVVSTTPQRFFDTNKTQAKQSPSRRPSRLSKLPPRSPLVCNSNSSARRKSSLPNYAHDTESTSARGGGDDAADPSPEMLLSPDSTCCAWEVVMDDSPVTTTVQQHPDTRIPGRTHAYTLDRVYGSSSTTLDMYEQSVRPLVESTVLEGYHASVFCYGQTSTGKTFTMTGTKQSPGLLPLAVQDCFRLCHRQHQGHQEREYLLRVSYVEIYNEQVSDLLSPTT